MTRYSVLLNVLLCLLEHLPHVSVGGIFPWNKMMLWQGRRREKGRKTGTEKEGDKYEILNG